MNKIKLKPCPFCGDCDIEVVREGNNRRSCIVQCTNCSCKLESNEIGYGEYWNKRYIEKIDKAFNDWLQNDDISHSH